MSTSTPAHLSIMRSSENRLISAPPADQRQIVEAAGESERRDGRLPGQRNQLAAVPHHADAEGQRDEVGNGAQRTLAALGQDIEQHVEPHVEILAHADGGTQEDEPAHHHDGAGLGPARRCVEDKPGKDLIGDKRRHDDEPGAGQIEREVAQPGQNGAEASQGRRFRKRRSASSCTRSCPPSIPSSDCPAPGRRSGAQRAPDPEITRSPGCARRDLSVRGSTDTSRRPASSRRSAAACRSR